MIRSLTKTLASALLVASAAVVTPALAADQATLDEGRKLAFDRKAGNCLACHMIPEGNSPGTIGPPLLSMQTRYDDKAKLRAQIWDATAVNPDSAMPPFGRHKILSEKQLDAVVEYIWSL